MQSAWVKYDQITWFNLKGGDIEITPAGLYVWQQGVSRIIV